MIILLCVMAVAALLAGVTAYFLAESGSIQLTGRLAALVPSAKHGAFLADLWAHIASYAVGSLGGLALCGWIVCRRRR
ncbi:MAG: hypothetical protein JW959_07810 [Pirellulales bacterium]|nr:hypothetical protein [Pirellulales bacterium]